MDDVRIIETSAGRILADDPDPVVCFRLLRDVLRRPADDPEMVQARESLSKSRWVQELECEQWSDGSWGRLHSMDVRAKQRIPTTEAGVGRAIALGLDANHRVLRKASGHLVGILETGECRDPAEKNDRWKTGVRLFSAATLAQMDPNLPALDVVWNLWADIAGRTLASGEYCAEAEVLAHTQLTGASVKDSYLVLNNRYALSLLGSRAERLPRDTEKTLVAWIWRRPGGIGYLDAALSCVPPPLKRGPFERWFTSLELMSRFPSSRRLAGDGIDWLWTQRNEERLWDFGPRSDWSVSLPLSESRQRRRNRQHDWSTRVLVLLMRYHKGR
jgi:hypothetical protein